MKLIDKLRKELENLSLYEVTGYYIPKLWIEPDTSEHTEVVEIHPATWMLNSLRWIQEHSVKRRNEIQSEKLSMYGAIVRNITCFDHNQNGIVDVTNQHGWRETGTFLKLICLLPYIKHLGFNSIHLLPINKIGKLNKKGNLGSVYAIANHYELDESLAEPQIQLSVDDQFAVFVECCHLVGIKVVVEFILRTTSVDNDWIGLHPDWFYWIKENNSENKPPLFCEQELKLIDESFNSGNRTSLPTPTLEYQSRYVSSPLNPTKKHGEWVAKNGSQTCKVPSSFADFPPDDKQPLWSDVTYLKMHSHPDFNYIAYNTIRMYDSKLNDEVANTELWEALQEVIPHFQFRYNIDGAFLDMCHALPSTLKESIVDKVKFSNEHFLLFEEEFDTIKPLNKFDGRTGDSWIHANDQSNFEKYISNKKINEIPFLSTLSNHNTPRMATTDVFNTMGVESLQRVWSLPNTIPYLMSGDELLDTTPINTGLGFTEQSPVFSVADLALFSSVSLPWLSSKKIISEIHNLLHK